MNLTEWRKQNDLTMTEAAKRLGVSQATISRLESGKHWPDRATIQKIIKRTKGGVTPNDFINESAA